VLVACAGSAPAAAQTLDDGRLVRVVYQSIVEGMRQPGTWGFLLGRLGDGRYCVRFGAPDRYRALDYFKQAPDICFDTIPGSMQSIERKSRVGDASQQGKLITVSSHHKGSIDVSGNDIALRIETCNKAEYQTSYTCFPNRYIVRVSGEGCSAEVTLFRGKVVTTTCEHYPAR